MGRIGCKHRILGLFFPIFPFKNPPKKGKIPFPGEFFFPKSWIFRPETPGFEAPSPSYWAALDDFAALILPGNDDEGASRASEEFPKKIRERSPNPAPRFQVWLPKSFLRNWTFWEFKGKCRISGLVWVGEKILGAWRIFDFGGWKIFFLDGENPGGIRKKSMERVLEKWEFPNGKRKWCKDKRNRGILAQRSGNSLPKCSFSCPLNTGSFPERENDDFIGISLFSRTKSGSTSCFSSRSGLNQV